MFGKKAQEGTGGGGELLLEIVLSSIVFFVIVIFLFAVNIPQQQVKAVASVVSADAALACDLSLINLLKAQSSQGSSYSEFLINSNTKFAKGDTAAFDVWKSEAKSIFDKTFSAGKWDLSATNQLGKVIASVGAITGNDLVVFGCNATVPLPEAVAKDCWWGEIKPAQGEPGFVDGDTVSFTAPGGNNVECEIIARDNEIGIEGDACKLVLERPGEESISNTVEDTTELDEIVLPITVNDKNYEITVTEKDESSVSVTLKRLATINECALTLQLRTTNVSAAV